MRARYSGPSKSLGPETIRGFVGGARRGFELTAFATGPVCVEGSRRSNSTTFPEQPLHRYGTFYEVEIKTVPPVHFHTEEVEEEQVGVPFLIKTAEYITHLLFVWQYLKLRGINQYESLPC